MQNPTSGAHLARFSPYSPDYRDQSSQNAHSVHISP
jgi:hypothetical protein